MTQISYIKKYKSSSRMMESVKSIHPWQSVIQTNYDIIKAHGGELKVETKENEFATFIITLPQ